MIVDNLHGSVISGAWADKRGQLENAVKTHPFVFYKQKLIVHLTILLLIRDI